MRDVSKQLKHFFRPCAAGAKFALLCILAFLICVSHAYSQTVPPVVVSQVNWLAALPNGGALAGGDAAGSSFAVNSNGDVIISTTYGGSVIMISNKTGAVTTLGSYNNVGPVTVDSQNNLYVGGLYTNNIIKVPYVNGAYVALSAPAGSTSPAACTGNDTTECNFGGYLTDKANGFYFGVVSIAFDAAGDFFYALTNANTAPNAIFECTVACLSTGNPGPVLIYQEPAASSPSTTGQLMIGEMAIDSAGNLFFTDSAENSAGNESYQSNLNEIPVSTGAGYNGATTGYAAAPTVLYNITPGTPGAYDDQLDGVAIQHNPAGDTVYFADEYNGTFAIPDPSTGIAMTGSVPTNLYAVSTQGAKILAIDASNNLYTASYVTAINSGGADTVGQITIGSVIVPSSSVGTASSPSTTTNPVTTLINDGTCSGTPAAAVTFAAQTNITPTATATVATTGTCSSTMSGGSAYKTTVSFTPSVATSPAITEIGTDQSSNTGIVTIGVAGQAGAAQSISFANPGTQTEGQTLALGATASSLLPVSFSSATTSVCSVSGTTATFITGGSCTIDANQLGNDIYAAATQESQSFTVLATQTITFANPGSQTVGTPLTLSATSSSGLTVTFTSSTSSVCTVSGTTASFIAVGTCTINANQAGNSVYAPATQVSQSFAVASALLSQTITFANPGAQTKGTTLTLTATASSGLPVTFTSATTSICTVSGTTASFIAPGTCTIDANQSGNSTYAAAPQVAQSFTVNGVLLQQTITFANPGAQVYGTPLNLVATASSGLTVGFSSATPSVCTVGGTTATFVNVGTCTIDANQPGDAAYAAAPQVVQSFTVSPIGVAATPVFSPAPGSFTTAQTVTITESTPGAVVYYTLDGSTPTTNSTVYSGAITVSSSETINAIAVNSPAYTNSPLATAAYVINPNFTLTASPASITITPTSESTGASGSTTLTFSPVDGINTPVTFTCSGLPANTGCVFNPTTFTPTSTAPVHVTLTIYTVPNLVASQNKSNPLIPGTTLALALCLLGFKKRRRLQMFLLLGICAAGLSFFTGCGGTTTKPVTSTVTVTATSTASSSITLTQTTNISLTIN